MWVAIAYDPGNGAHGWANNKTTKYWAIDAARGSCFEFGGKACVEAAWATNNGCAALAVDGDRWSGSDGPNLAAAENAALAKNGGGHIVLSRCSEGGAGTGT